MRRRLWTLVLPLLAACGSSSGHPVLDGTTDGAMAADRPASSADSSPPDLGVRASDSRLTGIDGSCPPPIPGTWYVDAGALAGGNGSQLCPLRTITQALAAAAGSGQILLAPGTYDAAIGERFPLVVPLGVSVSGDTSRAPSRTAFVIDGSGMGSPSGLRYSVSLSGALRYLEVTDSSGVPLTTIVYVAGGCSATAPGPHLSLVTVKGGTTASVMVANGAAGTGCTSQFVMDQQSEVTGSAGDGVLVLPNPGTTTIHGSLIHGNAGDGIHVMLGASGSPTFTNLGDCSTSCPSPPATPPNDIYCNGKYGVEASASGVSSIPACGNAWNHNPATSSGSNPDYNSPSLLDPRCATAPAPGNCP